MDQGSPMEKTDWQHSNYINFHIVASYWASTWENTSRVHIRGNDLGVLAWDFVWEHIITVNGRGWWVLVKKQTKKTPKTSQIAVSYKWVASNGLKTKDFSGGYTWVTVGFSVYFTLTLWLLFKEYVTAFSSWMYWLKQQSRGSSVFTAKSSIVFVCVFLCKHVFACAAFKNNYGLVRLRQQAGGWNMNSPQTRPLPLSSFKVFCSLSHVWIQLQT